MIRDWYMTRRWDTWGKAKGRKRIIFRKKEREYEFGEDENKM